MLTVRAHKNRVCALAFDSTGKQLASGGGDKRVRLWNASTGEELADCKGHKGCVYSVNFAPDGRVLASGGDQRNLFLWDNATLKQLHSIDVPSELVFSVVFSRDGKWMGIASGIELNSSTHMGEVLVRSVFDDCTLKATLRGFAWSLDFSPDGSILAVGEGDSSVTLWKWKTRQSVNFAPQGGGVRSVAFSPDGRTLATAAGATVNLWDVASGALRAAMKGHKQNVWAVAFLPNGKTLLSGSEDATVRMWDVAGCQERDVFDWHIGKVRSLAVAPHGMLAAAGGHEKIVIWDIVE